MSLIASDAGVLKNGKKLIRYYSDKGMKIIQIPSGLFFDDAVELEDSGRSYEESDTPIEDHQETS